jgi:ADP-ribosylation factor related protein 1
MRITDSIIADDRIEGVPTLVLANKQDEDSALAVEEIKEMFNKHVTRIGVSEGAVLPLSALKGCETMRAPTFVSCSVAYSDGVRQAVDWLFLRVQNSRKVRSMMTLCYNA